MTRNTPTHVGKTLQTLIRRQVSQKHPHARGEDSIGLWTADKKTETPPRTWGRHNVISLLADDFGNTPTHVGKTMAKAVNERLSEKHPHARGEDTTSATISGLH